MKKSIFIQLLLILATLWIWLLFYNQLPETIPTHWNYMWQADNFWPKAFHIFGIPGLMLVLTILFNILPKLDPKKDKYEQFSKVWEIMKYSFIIFFAYIYFVTIYIILNPSVSINLFMNIWLWILFVVLGNYMGKIRQNYFVGIKTPWTLANEEVWNKTHRLWGWSFMLAWLIFILSAFMAPWFIWISIVFLIIFCLIIPIIYSYLIFKKIGK